MPATLRRIFVVLGIYAVIGPLVGLVVFALTSSLFAIAFGPGGGGWLGAFFLIYGLVFAHFVGLPWALLAGAVAASINEMVERSPRWIGPVSGSVSFAGSLASGVVPLDRASTSRTGDGVDRFGQGFVVVMFLVFVVSATVCWSASRRLSRRWDEA